MSKKGELFCQTAQNFVWFQPYDYVQISSECGPDAGEIMYGEILDFQCQHINKRPMVR